MKEIINNLALITINNFCKENDIDITGTHLYKHPRKWAYSLIKDYTSDPVCTVTLHKNKVPTFT